MRGASTSEYVLVLAVVLIIGIVASAMLSFYPSVGAGAKETASTVQWSSARPLAVLESQYSQGAGDLTVVLQNTEAGAKTIRSITVKPLGSTTSYTHYLSGNNVISPGQKLTVSITGLPSELDASSGISLGFCVLDENNQETCTQPPDSSIPMQTMFYGPCYYAGHVCSLPSQCCSQICQSGTCCVENGHYCGTNNECCQGSCLTGQCCFGGAGTSCSNDSDCCQTSEPLVCTDGYCTKQGGGCKPNGISCGTNPECCSLVCSKGFCGGCVGLGNTGCDAATPCCGGKICDEGTCAECMGNWHTTCTKDSDCCSNACDSGMCVPCKGAGASCGNNNSVCCSNVCTMGVCSCSPEGSLCGQNPDCCSNACGPEGKCIAAGTLPRGQPCEGNDQCASVICAPDVQYPQYPKVCTCIKDGGCNQPQNCCSTLCGSGGCYCKQKNEACSSDDQCCSQICNGGFCDTTAECHVQGSDCLGTSQCCNMLSCNTKNKCEPCLPTGKACTTDASCCQRPSSQICTSNGATPVYSCTLCTEEGKPCNPGKGRQCCIGSYCDSKTSSCAKCAGKPDDPPDCCNKPTGVSSTGSTWGCNACGMDGATCSTSADCCAGWACSGPSTSVSPAAKCVRK